MTTFPAIACWLVHKNCDAFIVEQPWHW